MNFDANRLEGKIIAVQKKLDSSVKKDKKRLFDLEIKAKRVHFRVSDNLKSHPIRARAKISAFLTFSDEERKKSLKILSR